MKWHERGFISEILSNKKNIGNLLNKYTALSMLVIVMTAISLHGIYNHQTEEEEAFSKAYEVTIQGVPFAIVRNKDEFWNALEDAKKQIQVMHEKEVLISDEISFAEVKTYKGEVTAHENMVKSIKRLSDVKVKTAAIVIDGETIVLLDNTEIAWEILDELKAEYSEGDDVEYISVEFYENVVVEELFITNGVIRNKEEALYYLRKGTDEAKIHTVVPGENSWAIAKKYKLTVKNIEEANPEINSARLKIGQELNLIVPKPYISVLTKEYATITKPIPFDTRYTKTNAIYAGDRMITTRGVQGQKEIRLFIARKNGEKVEEEILEEEIIFSPTTRVIAQGTKPRPETIATGIFANPTRGRLTSPFGMRWGRRHEGIDIAAPIGTSIIAADGGLVTFAGRRGAYGNLVIVNHENGFQTYYAHCHRFHVKVGDRVHKGQIIATVGNTGRSTGPHLHFEVRKNGVPVNPMSFVNY